MHPHVPRQELARRVRRALRVAAVVGLVALPMGCTKFPWEPKAVAVAAGNEFACALRDDGSVACWGWNSDGQLGIGTTTDRSRAVRVDGLSGAVVLDTGDDFACVVRRDGSAACWGSNLDGQLGTGAESPR